MIQLLKVDFYIISQHIYTDRWTQRAIANEVEVCEWFEQGGEYRAPVDNFSAWYMQVHLSHRSPVPKIPIPY
jgi:hypothetical protein